MGLPGSGFHDLGERGALGALDQRQGSAPFFAVGALASVFGAFWAGLRDFAPVRVFWPLGALFFRLAAFFKLAFAGATGAPGSAVVAAVSLISVFGMVLSGFLSWLRSGAPDVIPLLGSQSKAIVCRFGHLEVPANPLDFACLPRGKERSCDCG